MEVTASGQLQSFKNADEATLNAIQPTDVRGMLDFENDLLRIANEDLGIISLIEKIHLERIKEDRNVCAHPTFSADGSQFVPPPELARSYIVQAANYLLINAPLKGKVVVKSIFELITANSFPTDKEKAFEQFWLKMAGTKERAKYVIAEYYKRVEKANVLFTSYKEGWKTDRGMLTIVMGMPNTVYKTTRGETWIYGSPHNMMMSLTFNFNKEERSDKVTSISNNL